MRRARALRVVVYRVERGQAEGRYARPDDFDGVLPPAEGAGGVRRVDAGGGEGRGEGGVEEELDDCGDEDTEGVCLLLVSDGGENDARRCALGKSWARRRRRNSRGR